MKEMMLIVGQILADSAGWGWMAFGWVFMLSLIALVVWSIARDSRNSGGRLGKPDPEEILTDRFARGEMFLEEFEERRAALRG